MQFVNDDMDDLYRKAAEDYPLKTDGADWDKLLQKMEKGSGVSTQDKKENKAKLLWLLLLLPMFFICNHYMGDNGRASQKEVSSNSNSSPDLSSIKQKEPSNKTNAETNVVSGQDTKSIVTAEATVSKKTSFQLADKTKENSKLGNQSNRTKLFSQKIGDDELKTAASVSPIKDNETPVSEAIFPAENNAPSNKKTTEIAANENDLKKEATAIQNATIVSEEKKTKDTVITATTTKQQKQAKATTKKLYWGIIAGPDFSMVKSGKVHGVGLSYGLTGGYRFAKKWAVETGVLWDKKDYESDGQYFKTEKAGWPQHTNVIDIWGYCNMFEVPLTIRYDLSVNKHRTWFATAGVSSYFMKKEKYDYNVERYGVQYYGHKVYKNSSNNWFSIMHVSVGYEKSLGRMGSLRIEPYVKLPVRGVGLGSLPLRSTGLYVGLTRSIR